MNWAERCAAVIPCRDEAASIAGLVGAVRRLLPLVLVVDDNSRDQTAARAIEAGAQAVRRTEKPGKGAAIKAGIAAALARRCNWVLTLDGDGQHRPDDIPTFLYCAEQTGAALVVGDRMHRAEEIPWLRRRVNRWMSRRISALAGRSLPDSQCGFRLINLRAWAEMDLETDCFETESEMLLAFIEAGYRVKFVPIEVVGEGPRSHIHPIKDSWRWLRWWNKARRRRLATSPSAGPAVAQCACAAARGPNMF